MSIIVIVVDGKQEEHVLNDNQPWKNKYPGYTWTTNTTANHAAHYIKLAHEVGVEVIFDTMCYSYHGDLLGAGVAVYVKGDTKAYRAAIQKVIHDLFGPKRLFFDNQYYNFLHNVWATEVDEVLRIALEYGVDILLLAPGRKDNGKTRGNVVGLYARWPHEQFKDEVRAHSSDHIPF